MFPIFLGLNLENSKILLTKAEYYTINTSDFNVDISNIE